MTFPVGEQRETALPRKLPARQGGLHQLGGPALAHFQAITVSLSVPRGARLFEQGQPVTEIYLLREGQVKLLARSAEGRTVIARIAQPDDVLGLSAALNELPHEVTAEAISPCSFQQARREPFLEFLHARPEAGIWAACVLAREHQELLAAIRRLALSPSATARVAQMLLALADQQSRFRPAASFHLALSHTELASLGAVSRETVTRVLNQFERDGLLSRSEAGVALLQRPELETIAGLESWPGNHGKRPYKRKRKTLHGSNAKAGS
jgi:CRP/FNR family transcriptional regulator